MLARLSSLSLKRRLALAAFALGALAVFADVQPGRALALHEKDLLTAIARQEDHVTPAELAGFIIEGRSDYRLLDLREPKAFATYRIPTAENVPLAALTDVTSSRIERLIVYSEGDTHAAQAWMLLRARGHRNVSTLRGGLEAWRDEVLFPAAPVDPDPAERQRFERAVEVAKHFGGEPRGAGAAETALMKAPELPRLEVPSTPAGGAAAPRKRRQGC